MPLDKPLPDFLATLRELLLDDLSGAIKLLLSALPERGGPHDVALALLGHLRDADKQRLRGTLSNDDLQLQYNQIRSAFIDLLSSLEDYDFKGKAHKEPGNKQAAAGTLLYNIPDTMPMREETRCVVRIAVDGKVIKDGLPTNEETTLTDLHRISELMQVEVFDPSPNGIFTVRSISTAEQLVEKEGFTEWIFFVAPQKEGRFPLVVKVAVIELLHGQERKKEIVLEEMVEVLAEIKDAKPETFKTAGYNLTFHQTEVKGPVKEAAAPSEQEAFNSNDPWDTDDLEPKNALPPPPAPPPSQPYPENPEPLPQSATPRRRSFPMLWLLLLFAAVGVWYFSDNMFALFASKGPGDVAEKIVNSDASLETKLQKLDSLIGTVARDTSAFRKVAAYKDTLDVRYWKETVQKSRTKSSARKYLELFPQGNYAPEAKSIIRPPTKKDIVPESPLDSIINSVPPSDTSASKAPQTPKNIAENKSPGMVLMPGGTIEMGDTWGRGLANEKPVHGVKVAPFYIGAYEVTFEEYDNFCRESGRLQPTDNGWGRGDMPVINIGWYDAVAYCNWLSKQQRLKPVYTIDGFNVSADWSANGYRLPLESEWEYAARGARKGQTWQFSGSGNADEVAWFRNNAADKPHAIGLKRPNELGLYDMSGNVAEWCWNWMAPYPNTREKAAELAEGSAEFLKVYRGGSFQSQTFRVRVSSREAASPSSRLDQVGFRVARNAGR
ncbi:MAG: formylglycine-generating enzyme family protein [Saprospiraceae bacterium]|nr:formylglycine-generating enzyme family protein [Saprospiraceae bacterium]